MNKTVKIAVDAMGGENAPKKILKGIEISLKNKIGNYFYIFVKKLLDVTRYYILLLDI